MTARPPARVRVAGRPVALIGAAAIVLWLGAGITAAALAPSAAAPAPCATATTSPGVGDVGRIQDPVAPPTAPTTVPVSIAIPDLGVASTLETLAVSGSGRLQPPVDPAKAGWFAAGVVPGQVGPAIIAGHVDYSAGPGVFQTLSALLPGAAVDVTMSDGAVLRFVVTGRTQSAKAQFPTSEVYGPTPDPELRLICCAGVFDRRTAHYVDNLVVFAKLGTVSNGS
jgi:hypothetical protein